MNERNTDECMEYEEKIKYTDKKLQELVEIKYNIKELHIMEKNNRDTIICEIIKESKASIKQLARVLEIGEGVLRGL